MNITTSSDQALVKLTLAGDLSAYSELVKRHEQGVRSCVRARLAVAHEAEDLAQETFILAYNKLDRYEMNASFPGWLRGIAINLLRNHVRKKQLVAVGGADELEQLIDHKIDTLTESGEESQRLTRLQTCFAKLDDKLQQIVKEHYTLGYTVAELCERYGERHSTMTMRLFRVRQKLKSCIDNLAVTSKQGGR